MQSIRPLRGLDSLLDHLESSVPLISAILVSNWGRGGTRFVTLGCSKWNPGGRSKLREPVPFMPSGCDV